MKRGRRPLIAILATLLVGASAVTIYRHPPILTDRQSSSAFGDVEIARPAWGGRALAAIFVDPQTYPPPQLGKLLAASGATVAVIDAGRFLGAYRGSSGRCLDAAAIATAIDALALELKTPAATPIIVAGIGSGALMPFLHAQARPSTASDNISIDFSIDLPAALALCPPLTTASQGDKQTLASAPSPQGHWRTLWTDAPPDATGAFIKALTTADTRIAAYDTPLDLLLAEELARATDPDQTSGPPLPVIEMPSAHAHDTLTLFYSGDGGWRDLDRTVAGEMTKLDYPVVGVDVLRYFWTHKSPEQAAADLSATMAYYRQHWGTRAFVLTGYSFGADVMPAIYNRLPASDQSSVKLLVLLALANTTNLEVHIADWVVQGTGAVPVLPELARVPSAKILCIYGTEEKADSACTSLEHSAARVLELPGGHHFDEDYPKLTRLILEVYRQTGLASDG